MEQVDLLGLVVGLAQVYRRLHHGLISLLLLLGLETFPNELRVLVHVGEASQGFGHVRLGLLRRRVVLVVAGLVPTTLPLLATLLATLNVVFGFDVNGPIDGDGLELGRRWVEQVGHD